MAAYAPLVPVESNLILLGAVEVGQETLIRFYVFHVIAFPLITAIFMVIHFWRIRKDGGISGPV
jgi:quinol-cytochrome oxidoreductase complex cytochrome b subunit